MQLSKHRILLASAATLLVLSGCNADQDAKPTAAASTEVIVATVNGAPINKSSIDMIVNESNGQQPVNTPEAREAIVNQLIIQTLIADEAIKQGLDKTPAVADQLNVLKLSVLSNAYIQNYLDTQKPSDDELKAEYELSSAPSTTRGISWSRARATRRPSSPS